jgi:hypothetical protein
MPITLPEVSEEHVQIQAPVWCSDSGQYWPTRAERMNGAPPSYIG